MFEILKDKTICLTRGDIANIEVSAMLGSGEPYTFAKGDVLRLTVVREFDYRAVVLCKDVTVDEETEIVTVSLTSADTKLGEPVNSPVDFWYEIEINPDTAPQTIVAHNENGPRIFRLYPEGGSE